MPVTFSNGKTVGDIGYGLMDSQAFEAMKAQAALTHWCTFWNGGEFYGTLEQNSLTLLKRYFAAYPEDREKVVLSIKGCATKMMPDCSPESIRRSVENSILLLGYDPSIITSESTAPPPIDYFLPGRLDPSVSLESTVDTFKTLIKEHKISGYMLSEVNVTTIRKAHAISPVSGVEVEVSLWSRETLTNGVMSVCAELGIPLIAYSPVGRGVLTGSIKSLNDLPKGDPRNMLPRFQPDTFSQNLKIINALEAISSSKGITPAQLAIAWVQSRPNFTNFSQLKIVSIPGSTVPKRVIENAKAGEVVWTDDDEREIRKILEDEELQVVGQRYPDYIARYSDQ